MRESSNLILVRFLLNHAVSIMLLRMKMPIVYNFHYITNDYINGDEVESASLPFVSNLDGKYYYSCKYNYISSISSSSICYEDNDQLLVVENNNNEMVNSISATAYKWYTLLGDNSGNFNKSNYIRCIVYR